MVAAANQAVVASPDTAASSSTTNAATSSPETPPVIQINGNNPSTVQMGATYNDLGATITGPAADLNLDIHTFVDGISMEPVWIDTSVAATDTIDYVVSDQNGPDVHLDAHGDHRGTKQSSSAKCLFNSEHRGEHDDKRDNDSSHDDRAVALRAFQLSANRLV